MEEKGYLVLENGEIFEGFSFGKEKDTAGEVVFNTGMVGYPESLTDPSYAGQILTLTYPLIGNYGVPKKEFFESEKVQVAALVVTSYIDHNKHWQAETSLASWLKKEGIPALSGIDTRALTKTLREKGVMKAVLTFSKPQKPLNFIDINKENLLDQVSCKKPQVYGSGKRKILLIDCGVKLNQIRMLVERKCQVLRLPWDYNLPRQELAGVVVSNGPGDPKMATKTIDTVRQILSQRIPTLGICLGNQILSLAAGGNTYKLKYGHRGQNQPVRQFSGRCFMTTQNHGFAIDSASLPSGWMPWFVNLNDGTNEGLMHKRLPFYSVQFHPEAKPGPTDTAWIFDYFLEKIGQWRKRN